MENPAHQGARAWQASGSDSSGAVWASAHVRSPMPSDEDVSRVGSAARRRYLMRYVAVAVGISAAICIAAGVRAATKQTAQVASDVSLRPSIVRALEAAPTTGRIDPAPASSAASAIKTPVAPAPLPPSPAAAVVPRPSRAPAARAAPVAPVAPPQRPAASRKDRN